MNDKLVIFGRGALGFFFIVAGLVHFTQGNLFIGLLFNLAGLFCFQTFRETITAKTGIKIHGGIAVFCIIGFSLLAFSEVGTKINNEEAKRLGFDSVEKYKEAQKQEANAKIQAKEQACRKDLACWGEKNRSFAAGYCQTHIERLAKYSFEWDGGRMFDDHFQWEDEEKGIISYFGDKIKFQNGFGASQNYMYYCIYDTLNEQVIEVGAEPGHLGPPLKPKED